jgi:hypothetical protein
MMAWRWIVPRLVLGDLGEGYPNLPAGLGGGEAGQAGHRPAQRWWSSATVAGRARAT